MIFLLSTALISQHSFPTHTSPTSLTEILVVLLKYHLFWASVSFFFFLEYSFHSSHTCRPTFHLFNSYSFFKTHTPTATFFMTVHNCFSDLKVLPLASTTPLNISTIGSNIPYSYKQFTCLFPLLDYIFHETRAMIFLYSCKFPALAECWAPCRVSKIVYSE